MMKITLFALAALVAVCAIPQDATAPTPAEKTDQSSVQIVKQESSVDVDGYKFEYETSDGTSRQEEGDYKNDTEQQGLVVKGSYRYVAPDGQKIEVTFVADKNGYQPSEQAGDDSQQQQTTQS